MRALFDNRKKDTSGQLLTMGRSGSSISNTLCRGPDKNGWAENSDRMPYVEYAESAVPSSRRMNQGLAFTQDGALYITGDAVTSTSNKVNGIAIRADGALHVAPAGSTATLKSNGMGITASGQVIMAESFVLPLNTSVVPLIGTGSATYTRATVATVFDNESVLRNVLSGEARFQGARRVRNFLTNSEILTGWNLSGSGAVTSGHTDPLGGVSAYRVVTSTAAGNSGINNLGVPTAGVTSVSSVWLRGELGGEQVQFGDASNRTTVTLTTSWRRYSSTAATTFSIAYVLYSNSLAQTWYAWHPQYENVTGQSNQAPSEYVSVGVLSTPFHGAGVDGVKYLSTTNGNSVASNVVTEASGSPISASTLLGYLAEPARTNSALWSRDMTNAAWVKTTMTTAQTATGIDGVANSATTLTATAGNAMVLQTLVAAATTRGYAPYIKRISGVGAVQITQDGIAWTTVTITSAWTRVTPLILSQLNPVFGIRLVDNADSVAVDMNQFETTTGTVVYGPIVTTTAAVTRNGDFLTYPFAGNTTEATSTLYAEVSTAWTAGPDGLACMAVGFGGGVQVSPMENTFTVAATSFQQSDGTTNNAKNGLASTATGVRKRASSWGALGQICTGDGLAPAAPQPYDGSYGSTAVGIGCNPASAQQWGGTIRNIRIYSAQLSAAQLSAVTV